VTKPNPNPRAIKVNGKQRPYFGIAGDFEDLTAIAYAAMLESRGGGFQTPPMASP